MRNKKNQIELTVNPRSGVIEVTKAINATEADIAKAKADFYAKAKKIAAARVEAMRSFDAQFLGGKAS